MGIKVAPEARQVLNNIKSTVEKMEVESITPVSPSYTHAKIENSPVSKREIVKLQPLNKKPTTQIGDFVANQNSSCEVYFSMTYAKLNSNPNAPISWYINGQRV